MIYLKALAFLLAVCGFGIVISAKEISKRFNLDKRTKVSYEHEMTEEEIEKYKLTKSAVNIKMIGMLVALPGLILILIIFR